MALANSLRPYSLLFLSHGPDVDQSKLSNAEVLPSTAICSLTAEEYRFTRSNKNLLAYDLRHFVLSSLVAFWRSKRGFHQLISDTIRLVGFQFRLFWKSTRNSRRYSYELIISASLISAAVGLKLFVVIQHCILSAPPRRRVFAAVSYDS